MAYDLTLSGPTYNASGKFGQSLSGGYGLVAGVFPTSGPFTFDGWFKTTNASGSNRIIIGLPDQFYMGIDANNKLFASSVAAVSAAAVNDGVWHHYRAASDGTNVYLFLDGALIGSGAAPSLAAIRSNTMGVGCYGDYTNYPWVGELDDISVWSICRGTTAFTPPTTAQSNSATGLTAIYHLDGNGVNSMTAAAGATAVTLALSGAFCATGAPLYVTVSTDAALTGAQSESIALSCNVAGTFSPSSVTLNSGTASAVATFTPSAAGAATITATATGTPTLSNGTAAFTAQTNAQTVANVVFSPYNWNIAGNVAKTVMPGAYFRFAFGGTTCALQFDTSALTGGFPLLCYRFDNYGSWTTTALSQSMVLTIPAALSAYANHVLEMYVRETDGSQSRWSPQAAAVALNGIVLDSGKSISLPYAKPLKGLVFGDSITETNPSGTGQGEAASGYARLSADILGAEVGIVGFSYQGFVHIGNGSVPIFGSTYNYQYSGVARSFAPAPDYIVVNQGTNDGASDITAAATTVFNALLALNTTTNIFVMRPFNGNAASYLAAAVSAISNPRLIYVDTSGWWNSANSPDGLHPNTFEHARLAPMLADVIRPYVQPVKGVRTARTVTITLNDRTGAPRANLSGLKWAFFDQTTAGALGVAADSGTVATTNASGVLALTVNTTLAGGATGWLVLSDSAGNAAAVSNAFSGPVTVA